MARFLSVDPLTSSYPMLTPYQFASNRPIDGFDLDGLEYCYFMSNINNDGQTEWKLAKTQDIITMSTGVGDIDFKLSKYGIEASFAYYDVDCSWRLIPDSYINFSLNKITDEEWQSFTTIDEIESKVQSMASIGNKAESAIAIASLFDGINNLYKAYKYITKVGVKLSKAHTASSITSKTR